MPQISIIIPLYNKENCIRETLDSVLSQSYEDFEIVVVNDGSKDNSVAVVESMCDSRIRLINKENEGVSKTRNRGIKEAKGEWLLFLDADDTMENGCLQALIDLGQLYPQANVLCGNFITKTEKEDIDSSSIKENCLIPDPFKLIWKKMWNMRLGSFIAKKEILPQYPEDMAKGEDVLYCFNVLNNGVTAYTPHNTMIYVRENSELSGKILPLEKCLSWGMTFKGANTYQKSIYIDILVKGILVYLFKYKKPSYSFRLMFRHFTSILVYTPLYLIRKIF